MDILGEHVKFEASLVINLGNTERNIEIEKIAWRLFLSNLQLSFRRELTPDEKKQITEVESYQIYREQAERVLAKRQRALLNKKYPVIEVPADGKRDWSGGAYCLCFVYSKYKGNFVLKGYMREVEEYLKKNYTHYFYNLSLWHHGQNRDIWRFWKDDVGVFEVSIKERRKGKKNQIRAYTPYNYDDKSWREIIDSKVEAANKTLEFKRFPKRWIPEFDKF